MRNNVLLVLALLVPVWSRAQETAPLDWLHFRAAVLQHHPLARQADQYLNLAQATVLRAKGGFDPKWYADFSSKQFNGKTYFQYTETGIKWPLGLGLEIKGNYSLANGDFLNPESKIPKAGQVSAGINWTLWQGLLFDERRADVQQSRFSRQQYEAEWALARNNLLFDAAKAYWTWVVADNQRSIYAEALRQANIRCEALKESYRQGDKPAIDTLEAFLQVQNRALDLEFAQMDLQDAALSLGQFRWDANGQPLGASAPATAIALTEDAMPLIPAELTPDWLETALEEHPELLWYDAKQKSLEVERRLKREKLKPGLDLNYSLLGNGWEFFPSATPSGIGMLANDIKWGLQFRFPIPNRKARGDAQIAQVKIEQTNLARQQKRLDLEVKIRQYQNELGVLARQIAQFRAMITNYRSLLDAENEKFRFGESSVFLINAREQRWLEARIKFLKLLGEYRKTEAGLLQAAGRLAR